MKSPPRYLGCGQTLPDICLVNIEAFFNVFDIYYLDNLTASIKKSFAGAVVGFLNCLPKNYFLDVVDLYNVFNAYLGLRYKESILIESFQEMLQHCSTRLGYNYLLVADASLCYHPEVINIFGSAPGTYIVFIDDFDIFSELLSENNTGEEGNYIEVDDTSKYVEEVLNLKYLLIEFLEAKIDGTQEQEREDGASDEEDEEDEDEEYY